MGRKLSRQALLGLALFFVLPLLFAGPPQESPPKSAKASRRQIVLTIERSPHFGALLVRVLVNEKPAVLILDTGSNTTILSPEIAGLNPSRLPRAEAPKKGTGFVGDGRWGHVTLAIGALVWKDKRVLIVDTKDLSSAAQRKIDGILGQDILDQFRFVEIDLEEKRLTLASD